MTLQINYPHIHIDKCNKMWITAFKIMKKVVLCISGTLFMSYPQEKLNKLFILTIYKTKSYVQ